MSTFFAIHHYNRSLARSPLGRVGQTPAGSLRWLIRFDAGRQPDITVAVRLSEGNRVPLDYYLFPRLDLSFEKLKLAEDNQVGLDAYRFASLEFFFGMARRARIPEAA